MLVLITSSKLPYCFDIGHVLGLPTGNSYRFRYRNKWVAPDQLTGDIETQLAIVVLRDFDTGEFHPCRFVDVTQLQAAGNFMWLRFSVGNFPATDEIPEISEALNKHLLDSGVRNKPGDHLEPLVFSIDYETSGKICEDQTSLWDFIVSRLGKLQCYEGYSFGRIAGTALAGKSFNPTQDWSKSLIADRVYDLYVWQKKPFNTKSGSDDGNPYALTLSSEDGNCRVIRSHQRVVGNYDLLRYSFKTPKLVFSEQVCVLAVSARHGNIATFPPFPGIRFEFAVSPTPRQKIVAGAQVVAAVLAMAFFVFPEPFVRWFGWEVDGVRGAGMLLTLFATGSLSAVLKLLSSSASDKLVN